MMPRLGLQHDASGSKLTIQNTFANVAASQTDSVLVTGITGKRIIVLGIFAHLQGDTATNLTLNSKGSGAGTAICSTKQVAANGGYVHTRGCPTDFLFKTKPGESLTATTGAGSTVGLDIVYTVES